LDFESGDGGEGGVLGGLAVFEDELELGDLAFAEAAGGGVPANGLGVGGGAEGGGQEAEGGEKG
jgi:hypothetical protein